MEDNLFLRFGVSLFIGILVGLQREFARDEPDREIAAGIRTFSLMGLIGCTAALTADILNSPWPFVGILLILGAFFIVNYSIEASRGEAGLTTEFSAILTVLAGALAYWNHVTLAVALAVATTALLSFKLEMHRFARRITQADIYATLKFAVITAIVLPILPNRGFGPPPINVLNPYKIWLLVVFISGISFVGYVLIKLIGARKGIGLTGLLGGLASSTAVTLSFTQRSRSDPALAQPFGLAIIISWTVMIFRLWVIVAALNPPLSRMLLLPLAIMALASSAFCLYLYRVRPLDEGEGDVAFSNPFELGPAIKFGVIFSFILLISKAAQVNFGDTGIYLFGFVSGLADVDAIGLSMADLSRGTGGIDPVIAGRAIMLAAVANTLTKGGIVLIGGAPPLRRFMLPGILLLTATGIAATFLVSS